MPGHANSPYWTAVDFDSEEDDRSPPSTNRMYLDPWDSDAIARIPGDSPDSGREQFDSIAGEPVSASFYYVPTKNYDSSEEKPQKRPFNPEEIYGRRRSRCVLPEGHDVPVYTPRPVAERRRSMYVEEPQFIPHPLVYESMYGPLPVPPPGYVALRPRVSLTLHPDYIQASGHRSRRQSRMADAYESLPQDYEDWAHPMPHAAPNNFHLSRYGHLQIDYSCSWNSLDRLIRNH
ncbi:uncharacterized protein LOC110991578 isoform X1 [Pieris rapae]|uniref:uncharacterized protein LOC110991578 isoform X1 n=1 Tax=Pieris rapae TaxID=64459 RepID=UPI001E28077B|nr:uncharacterized protein LOC110991578 isoform X1 [Pieris rapae]